MILLLIYSTTVYLYLHWAEVRTYVSCIEIRTVFSCLHLRILRVKQIVLKLMAVNIFIHVATQYSLHIWPLGWPCSICKHFCLAKTQLFATLYLHVCSGLQVVLAAVCIFILLFVHYNLVQRSIEEDDRAYKRRVSSCSICSCACMSLPWCISCGHFSFTVLP